MALDEGEGHDIRQESSQTIGVDEIEETSSIQEEELAFCGEWDIVLAYNSSEGQVLQGNDIGITLHLNDDLSGSLDDNGESVSFTWNYEGTIVAPNDPSVNYLNYQCKLSTNDTSSAIDLNDDFYFDVDSVDYDTIYLSYGDWLYDCQRK